MSVHVARRHFSIQEYEQMVEAGILGPADRVELIDGEILEMRPIGERHAACVRKGNQLFVRLASEQSLVSTQCPVAIPAWSEPEPDIALLSPRADYYASGHPEPKDIQLLIEVADRSLEYDLTVKVPMYARAAIREVWVINLRDSQIHVFANPQNGVYQTQGVYGPNDVIPTKRVAAGEVAASDLLL